MDRSISARARVVRDGLSDRARASLKVLLGNTEAERSQGTYMLGVDRAVNASVTELVDAGCVQLSGQSIFITELGEEVLQSFNEVAENG